MVLTSAAGLMTTDSLRRVLEDMGADAYETMTYYERWIASIAQNMVEAGAVTTEELGAKMAEVRARGATYGAASCKCASNPIGRPAISERRPIYAAR